MNLPKELIVYLASLTPFGELRVGIPLGISIGLPLWETYLFSVLGNMTPVVFFAYLLGPLSEFLSARSKFFKRFFEKLFEKTRLKHSASFERGFEIGLVGFVAIPLPVTGGWSGILAAFVFGKPPLKSIFLILIGVLIAGVIVSLAATGAVSVFQFFTG